MTSLPDQELAQIEPLLRQRLGELAEHAPDAVRMPNEISVVATHQPARRGRRAGVIAAVTALIGAGGFTTYSFLGASDHGGAATPAEAVTAFVSAAEHEDVLGMIDVTLPEEVAVLRAAIDSVVADAKRIDVLDATFNTGGVQGLDISTDHLALDTNFYENGLASVRATGGTFGVSFDPEVFPFGQKLRSLLPGAQQPHSTSVQLGAGDPIAQLMTVERDGRWYVSVEYTVAEYVRLAFGWDVPGPVARAPIGFDSPEQAVTGFYDRLATLDVASAFDTFAPGEDAMAWLAQSWIADAQSAIDSGRTKGWSAQISGLTYKTIGTGDYLTLEPITFKVEGTAPADLNANSAANPTWPTVVTSTDGSRYALVPPGQVPATITGLAFSDVFPSTGEGQYNFTDAHPDGTITPLVFPAQPTDGPLTFSLERADGCTTYTGIARDFAGPLTFPWPAQPAPESLQRCGSTSGFGVMGLLLLAGVPSEVPSVSVVQSGGKWYVSPLGTALASVATSLHDLDAGSSLIDSPLAAFIYGVPSRAFLESIAKGRGVEQIVADCLPALIVENGKVTGVVADPPPDAVRACLNGSFSSSTSASSSSGVGVAPPLPVKATSETIP
ncbi:MAG: hypothetical protein QOE09_3292 [Ilumatobacteraceae bacterium]